MYKQAGEASRRRGAKVCLLCVFFYKTEKQQQQQQTRQRQQQQRNNKKNICIKQQTAHRFERGEGARELGALKRKLMRACLEKVDEKSEGGGGSVKENPKIQTPRRRRNHFINASFVREHGAGHGQDIAIRHMRPTWARGECDCPLPLPHPLCRTFLHC